MLLLFLFACCAMVSTVPVPDPLPPLLSQGGATQAPQVPPVEATHQNPQSPVWVSPGLEQTQAVPQLPGLQGGPQLVPSLQQYTWSPLGGAAAMMPLQPSIHESLPVNQPALPQQPLVFPPYGYFPLFLSPYTNQLFSPYGFPVRYEAPVSQTPASPPPNSPLLPAEAAPVAAPAGDAPQPSLQNGQIMYMLQQHMSPPLGSLSSEELEMAAKMSQLSVYVPTVLQTGAVQHVNQAAGLANPERQGTVPTASAGSGPQPHTNRFPGGLEKAAQATATVQTPVQAKVQRRQGNCGHQQ